MVKRINQTRSEGTDGDVSERVLADTRGHIWAFKGTFKELAIAANLSEATVSNLAYGITKLPRMNTLLRIMEAIGKCEAVLKAFESEKPVSVKQALRRKSTREKLRANRVTRMHPHRVERTRTSVRRAATMH